MLKMLTADQLTEPGAYEWFDATGLRHVGFLLKMRRGELAGSFVSADGNTRALCATYSDGSPCEGTFYGPLVSSNPAAA